MLDQLNDPIMPCGIRTHDFLIRSQALYPAELRALCCCYFPPFFFPFFFPITLNPFSFFFFKVPSFIPVFLIDVGFLQDQKSLLSCHLMGLSLWALLIHVRRSTILFCSSFKIFQMEHWRHLFKRSSLERVEHLRKQALTLNFYQM